MAQRQLGLALGAIDRRVGRGVYDHVGPRLAHARANRPRVAQIQPLAIERDELAGPRQDGRQLPPDLTVAAGEQDPQGNTWASRKRTPALSFAESTGGPLSGHSIPSSGSSQAIVRSCSGA